MLPNIDLEVYPMKTQKSFFEQNGGTYMQVGDVLLPDLSIGEVEQRPSIFYSEVWLVSNSEQVIVNLLCIQILICIRALVLAFFTDSDQIQYRKSVRNTK